MSLGAGLCGSASAAPAGGLATLDVQLQLERPDGAHATGVDVTYALTPSAELAAKPLTLGLDTLSPYLNRSSDQVVALKASDAGGDLPLTPGKAPAEFQGSTIETWTSARLPIGAVHVSYRMPVAMPRPAKRGPHDELQAAGDGVMTSGRGLLLLPVSSQPLRIHLAWTLPPGLQSASSYGLGDVHATADFKTLGDTLLAAGAFYTYPPNATEHGLIVRGLGRPHYDLGAVFAWAQRWYALSKRDFHDTSDKPFRLYFRSFDGGNQQSGEKLNGALQLYLPPDLPQSGALSLKQLFSHEIMHVWVPNLADDTDADAWYHEGQADYFSTTLGYAHGLWTPREYLARVNGFAAAYYGGAYRNVPNAGIPGIMWVATESWETPYARGFMYLAQTNALLLRRTGGKVGVRDVVLEVLKRQRRGEHLSNDDWAALVERHGGPEARAEFLDMLAGKLVLPPFDAFGPCFVAKATRIGVFQLGYSSGRNLSGQSLVESVDPGSNADKAGLRPGDIIKNAFQWEPIFFSPTTPEVLQVQRGGEMKTIRFLPRTGAVAARQWAPRSGNPDAPCG